MKLLGLPIASRVSKRNKQQANMESQVDNLWNGLALEEQEDLLISYEESFDALNLIDHEEAA